MNSEEKNTCTAAATNKNLLQMHFPTEIDLCRADI